VKNAIVNATVIVVLAIGAYLLYQHHLASQKPQSEAMLPVENLDRVVVRKQLPPLHFLHQTFTVDKYQAFPFEVPPSTVMPKLHGTFQSFVKRPAEAVSDEAARVEVMLMSPEQYSDFVHGSHASVVYAVDPSYHQEVQYSLAPTGADAAKYFLVFRSNSGGPKSVKADFEVTSD
jgi:hypothetical protein